MQILLKNKDLYILLAIIIFSLFGISLFFIPSDGDVLGHLSSAAKETNPFIYFIDDMTRGTRGLYRPFFSFSVWIYYRIFGVWYLPSQLLDILLHLLSSALVLRILLKLQVSQYVAFLSAVLAAVSVYATSPVPWGSERTLLTVAVCTLLVVNAYIPKPGQAQESNTPYFVILCLLAITNKESGLAVPLLILATNVFIKKQKILSQQNIVIGGIIVFYTIFRLIIFRNMSGYGESGYLYAHIPYTDLTDLPLHLRIIGQAENVLKNIIGVFLPIFSDQGKTSLSVISHNLPLWLPTICLVFLTLRKKLTEAQLIFLLVIFFNALIHFAVFRTRTLYVGQFALTLFIGSTFIQNYDYKLGFVKAYYVLVVLIFSHILLSANLLRREYDRREELLDKIDSLSNQLVFDKKVIQEVKQTYKNKYNLIPN